MERNEKIIQGLEKLATNAAYEIDVNQLKIIKHRKLLNEYNQELLAQKDALIAAMTRGLKKLDEAAREHNEKVMADIEFLRTQIAALKATEVESLSNIKFIQQNKANITS